MNAQRTAGNTRPEREQEVMRKAVDTEGKAVKTHTENTHEKAEEVNTHGKAVHTHGKAVDTQAKAVDTRGKAVDTHGKAVNTRERQWTHTGKGSGHRMGLCSGTIRGDESHDVSG